MAKSTYGVWRINWNNPDEAKKSLNHERFDHICHGLDELWAFCGCKLKRYRAGYGGEINGVEYIAVRIA